MSYARNARMQQDAGPSDEKDVRDVLDKYGLDHLWITRKHNIITVMSGPKDDPILHVCFVRLSLWEWALQVADWQGEWETTEFKGRLLDLVEMVVKEMGWLVTPRN